MSIFQGVHIPCNPPLGTINSNKTSPPATSRRICLATCWHMAFHQSFSEITVNPFWYQKKQVHHSFCSNFIENHRFFKNKEKNTVAHNQNPRGIQQSLLENKRSTFQSRTKKQWNLLGGPSMVVQSNQDDEIPRNPCIWNLCTTKKTDEPTFQDRKGNVFQHSKLWSFFWNLFVYHGAFACFFLFTPNTTPPQPIIPTQHATHTPGHWKARHRQWGRGATGAQPRLLPWLAKVHRAQPLVFFSCRPEMHGNGGFFFPE